MIKENILYLVVDNRYGHNFPTDRTVLVEMTEADFFSDDMFRMTDGEDGWWMTIDELEEIGEI